VALLNDRTPIDQFDVTGLFDYAEPLRTLDELRQTALATRPDLQAAQQSVAKAKTDHQLALANGSIDPTFGVDVGRNPPLQHYVGVNVSVPLRVFDRNQGEQRRTEIDMEKEQRMLDATQAQVLNDVDSAYATLVGALTLLRPYKTQYLPQAAKVRDTVTFSFQNGAASLLDFLDAQRAYRDVQVSYVNLIGSFLTAANQLNLALGREEIR
jgi:cobalt-zinc-cadmium efflux system outer membrane protein